MKRWLSLLAGVLGALALGIPLAVQGNQGFGGGGASGISSGSGTSGSLAKWTSATALGAYTASAACGAGEFITAIDAGGAPTCTASSGAISGLTTGLVPQAASATSLEDSSNYRISVVNDTGTGTTTNKLTKLTSAGEAVITSAAETSGVLGICVSGCGNSGSAVIALIGKASCVFDNATTAGHYATVSASTAGSCSDTGATTFPTAGTQTLGIITETGIAGTRTTFLATPDVASLSQGGGGGGAKNPAGAAGDVQYRATNNNFAAEAAFNYTAATNKLKITTGTLWGDAALTDAGFYLAGTLDTTPAATAAGALFDVTGAGSAAQFQAAFLPELLAGYTGSSGNASIYAFNGSAGTGTALSLGSTGFSAGNMGVAAQVIASTAGTNIGVSAEARSSTAQNIGVYGNSGSAVAGSNIGGLFAASNSSEGTDLKNVGVYATLNSSLLAAVNGSFAALVDGGTLPDATSNIIRAFGTAPSSPAGTVTGHNIFMTGAGTASQAQAGAQIGLVAGYTGSSVTYGMRGFNSSLGTGNTLNLYTNADPTGNIATEGNAGGVGSGLNVGVYGDGANSTGVNIGVFGKSVLAAAGPAIGVLGNANGSTEGTGLKDVGGWFTLGASLPNVNVSVALGADNGAIAAPIFNAYDNGSLVFSITDGGPVTMTSTITSSATGTIGWSIVAGANTACSSTCTSACVFGFDTALGGTDLVDCADTTADRCLCAGAS